MSPRFKCLQRLNSGCGRAIVPLAGTSLIFTRRLRFHMPDQFSAVRHLAALPANFASFAPLREIALGFAISSRPAAEHHGQVKFGGLPVPGATVTASQRDKIVVALTDVDGNFSFPDLPDGAWTIEVQMQGFASAKQDVSLAADSSIPDSELKILPLEEMHAQVSAAPAPNLTVAPTPAPANGNAKANANAKANGKGKQQT